jgi:uncharacterized protein YecE (DUF72 family)
VHRKELGSMGPYLEKFVASGLAELKSKLGPILWQLDPWHPFQPEDLEAFLKLLPAAAGKAPLRHVLEVRHKSFLVEQFVSLARKYRVAIACVDDAKHPMCADVTSDFVYARLRQCAANVATGYSAAALKDWSGHARSWAKGDAAADLPLVAPKSKVSSEARAVFIYFINGAKERAPAAAQALIAKLE